MRKMQQMVRWKRRMKRVLSRLLMGRISMEMKTNMAMLAKSTRMLSVFSMMLSLCAMS